MTELAETKSADVRLRVEPALKEEVTRILADAGLDLSNAIRIFFKQVVVYRGLPFEVRQPNAATLRAMIEARSLMKARFSSARELFDDLEKGARRKTRDTSSKRGSDKRIPKRLARTTA